eukprot:1621894-Lingulodinium_polyedra.AAC.1
MKEAISRCRGNAAVQGAFVLTEKDGNKYITATSGPVPWPEKGPKEKGRAQEDPEAGTRIWITTQGNVMWKAPPTE